MMGPEKTFEWKGAGQAAPTRLPRGACQPNEFDQVRIARALERRQRYRYVTPTVIGVSGGYRIEAPCCSRNIDPQGGAIEVALMLFDGRKGEWRLFRRDHGRKSWELHSAFTRLNELLDGLNADPERAFWQ